MANPRAVKTPSPERLRGIAEALTRLFYCLLAVAFLATVLGSPGRGFFLLVLGGLTHVARVGAEAMLELRSRQPAPSSSRARPARLPRRAPAAAARSARSL